MQELLLCQAITSRLLEGLVVLVNVQMSGILKIWFGASDLVGVLLGGVRRVLTGVLEVLVGGHVGMPLLELLSYAGERACVGWGCWS